MFEKYPYTNLHELNLDWIIGKVKEIEEGYDGIVSRMGAVELAMDNLEGDVATLQSSYRALSASVNAHSLAIENLGNSVTALRADVNTLLSDVNTLTATSASHTTQIADLSTRMTGAEGSITTLTSTANTHTSQIAALAARVNTIETTITSYGNRISTLETAVNILNMRTAANEADIATLEEILFTSGENVINLSSLPQTVNGITFALDTDGKTVLAQGTALSTGTGDASIALASPITTEGKYKISCAMVGNVGTSMRYVSTTNTSRTIIGSAIYVDEMQPSAGDLTYLTVSYGTAGTQVDCSFKPEIMELSAPESVPAIVITDETYSGYNPIIVTNAIGGEITALTSEVNAIQDLHGFAAPWSGGVGKNKLPLTLANLIASNTTGTWSGKVYTTTSGAVFTVETDEDDNIIGIKCTDIVNNGGSFVLNFTFPAGEYILSSGFTETFGVNDTLLLDSSNNVIARGNAQSPGQTFTLSAQDTLTWTFRIANDTKLCKPMIRLSNVSDSNFTPYTNICSITGRLSCEIEVESGNFFNASNMIDGKFVGSTGTLESDVSFWASDYVEVDAGKTYILSYYRTGTYGASIRGMRIAWYDSNKTFIRRDGDLETDGTGTKTISLTAPNNATYARYSCVDSNYGTNYKFIVIADYLTTFDSICYGGVLDVKNGVLTVTHAIVDLGSVNYTASTVGGGSLFYTGDNPFSNMKNYAATDVADALCSAMVVDTMANVNGGITQGLSIGPDSSRIRIFSRSAYDGMTAAEFKAAMNGVKLVYELDTPTTVAVDPQVIELARGYNEITSDSGNMDATIQTYISVPKPPTTDGTYVLTATVTDGMYALTWESTT